MQLFIEGKPVSAQPDMTLLDMVKNLDLDTDSYFDRPLAAKIAGEVFNLNYIPVR